MRELNCDVVIVGCGAAGLTAALAALQNGAKVIVLERSTVEDRGGNTRWTEAMLRMTQDGDPSADFIQRFTERAGYHVMPEFVQATAADYDFMAGSGEGAAVHRPRTAVDVRRRYPGSAGVASAARHQHTHQHVSAASCRARGPMAGHPRRRPRDH